MAGEYVTVRLQRGKNVDQRTSLAPHGGKGTRPTTSFFLRHRFPTADLTQILDER